MPRAFRRAVPALRDRRDHPPDRGVEADEHRLADQEMADVQFDDLRQGGDRARPCRSPARGRRGIRSRAAPLPPPPRAGARIRPRPCPPRPGDARCTRRRYAVPPPAPSRSARRRRASIDGSMNKETRMPARDSSSTKGASRSRPPTTSSPPSVVRSVRFSGTRQQACGRIFSAMSSICSVAAISKFSGAEIVSLRRRMSSSTIWRRSSRRCAVMPSAPAASAICAARTGSGTAPPRALRRVAT